jgi:FG-GAP-like repeat
MADFNGDGKLDLAMADSGCPLLNCSTPGAVSILLGFGDSTFVGQTDYSIQGNPSQVISADFNGDGKPDIAATALGLGPFGVYLGNGDGTFQPEAETSLTQPAGGFAAGDFNGDGKTDIAAVYSNCTNGSCLPGDAVVFIGNGEGTFQPPVEYAVGLQSENVYENLAVGDFNGNGTLDLAVANFGANTVSILLNNGNGTFQSHVDYPAGTGPTSIVTGDFNGDGILDLAILDSNGISILLGNGNGTFTPGTPVSMRAPYAMVGADFNADGKLDLAVTTTATPGQIFILLGMGDGTFQEAASYPTVKNTDFPALRTSTAMANLT